MFHALLYLVGIHAQVSSAAEPLLERALNALVEDLAKEALRCFRQVKRFGMGGMLRASSLLSLDALSTRSPTHRQRSRSSSCTRRSHDSSRLPQRRRCRIYITRFPRHMLAGLATRICKAILMASKRHWPTHAVRRASSSCVLDRTRTRRHQVVLARELHDRKIKMEGKEASGRPRKTLYLRDHRERAAACVYYYAIQSCCDGT